MAQVIGVIAGLLGIISFGENNFPKLEGPSTTMRIQVGLDGTQGLTQADGSAPDIRLFNENLDFIGSEMDPGHIDSGSYKDIKVSQDSAQQPTYVLFTGNDDAVCIAYMSATWPDDQKYGWVGNWGEQCGVSWYYSNIYIDGKLLDCTWLDKNGDATDVTAFSVHFPEFNDKGNGYNTDVNHYCTTVSTMNFEHNQPDSNTIYTKRDGTPVKTRGKRSTYNDNRLIRTTNGDHSASRLCESDTAVGPSMIAHGENLFCDMTTKTLLPLCADASQTDCFDVDTLTHRGAGNSALAARSIAATGDWDTVIHWN